MNLPNRILRKTAWMMRLAVAPVALGLSFAGCNGSDDDDDDGPSCVSLCEDAKDCPGSDQTYDCGAGCREAENLVEEAGCSASYDTLLDCAGDANDACNSDACAAESRALSDCLSI